MSDNNLSEAFALAVANARHRFDAARARQHEAVEAVNKLHRRISDIERQQRAIKQQRAEGESTTSDAQEFALLSADLETLNGMLKTAQAAMDEADASPERNALSKAESDWERHQNECAHAALATRTAEIERALLNAVRATHQAAIKAGMGSHLSQAWRPSTELSRLIHFGTLPTLPDEFWR
jgi:hypothetical protein